MFAIAIKGGIITKSRDQEICPSDSESLGDMWARLVVGEGIRLLDEASGSLL